MKKALSLVIAITLMLLSTPLQCANKAMSDREYDANENYEKREPLGYGTSKGTTSSISASMMGWGIGLAAGIAILAGIIHQSAAVHSGTTGTGTGSSSS